MPRVVRIALDPSVFQGWKRGLWILLALAILGWFSYTVREIWMPLAMAFLIAIVLDPVVDKMEQRKVSRTVAAALIFSMFLIGMGTVLYFSLPAVIRQAASISAQTARYVPSPGNPGGEKRLSALLDRAHAPPWVRSAIEKDVAGLNKSIEHWTNWLSQHAVELASNLIWLVIIPIVAFYALKDFHLIFAKGLLLIAPEKRDFVQSMVAEVSAIFARFLRGLMVVSFLNGVATWLLLAVLKTPNAFFLGAVAGVLYSIPYLGALLTIVLIAGVTFTMPGITVGHLILVIAASVCLHQFLFDQIITPRILGRSVGLHPILSIVALLAGNAVLGILGMLLAVPVAASVQALILALEPKLAFEIDVSALDKMSYSSHAPEEPTSGPDATADMHTAVGQAVDAIEAVHQEIQAIEEEITEEKAVAEAKKSEALL